MLFSIIQFDWTNANERYLNWNEKCECVIYGWKNEHRAGVTHLFFCCLKLLIIIILKTVVNIQLLKLKHSFWIWNERNMRLKCGVLVSANEHIHLVKYEYVMLCAECVVHIIHLGLCGSFGCVIYISRFWWIIIKTVSHILWCKYWI